MAFAFLVFESSLSSLSFLLNVVLVDLFFSADFLRVDSVKEGVGFFLFLSVAIVVVFNSGL